MQEGFSEVQELTFAFSRFHISVQVRVTERLPEPSENSSLPEVEVTASEGPAAPISFSVEIENQTLAANLPGEYAALDLDFLSHLERRLTAVHPIWTAKARIGRAFKAGLVARNLLDHSGPTATETPSIPFRNTIYVILRSPSLPQGGWTLSYNRFLAQCGGDRSHGAFHPSTVCHAFATRTEADVYLVGAKKTWPPQLQ
eukprot:Skav229527  [mRNA]  locus=scaffold451:52057:52656:+ [translate_table: standard]